MEQLCPLDTQKVGSREIDFQNFSSLAECEIANPGKIVEIGIHGSRLLNLCPIPPQLLILHLQLNLMYVKLVDELLDILVFDLGDNLRIFGERLLRPLPQWFFFGFLGGTHM
jgi:hypothetical protein